MNGVEREVENALGRAHTAEAKFKRLRADVEKMMADVQARVKNHTNCSMCIVNSLRAEDLALILESNPR